MRGSGRTRAFEGTTYTVFPVNTLSVAVYKMNINYKCHDEMFYVQVFFYRLVNFTNCYKQYSWNKTPVQTTEWNTFDEWCCFLHLCYPFQSSPLFLLIMGYVYLSMSVFKKACILYLKYWYVAMSSKIHLKWVYLMIK